jgi:hypothetical protein
MGGMSRRNWCMASSSARPRQKFDTIGSIRSAKRRASALSTESRSTASWGLHCEGGMIDADGPAAGSRAWTRAD